MHIRGSAAVLLRYRRVQRGSSLLRDTPQATSTGAIPLILHRNEALSGLSRPEAVVL